MCLSQEEGELNSGCWHALKGALLMEKVHMMGNSGMQSPSEGQEKEVLLSPVRLGVLGRGPPTGVPVTGWGGGGEQVRHKYSNTPLLLLSSSSQGPVGQPQMDSSRHRNCPLQGSASQGPEEDGE